MQSNIEDVPPMVEEEGSKSPEPMKWVTEKHADVSKVDEGGDGSVERSPNKIGGDGSVERSSNNVTPETKELTQTQSDLEDAPLMMKKDCSRSPQLAKKVRKRARQKAEVDVQNGGFESNGSASQQLVLYNPGASNASQDIVPGSDHSESYSSFRNLMASNHSNRVLPSVGAFTVQCANCFKWRLIPTKEKYEEIREHILEKPFTCEQARAWRPDISCDDPADISQDGSRLWAIDKPNIAQPPPGWERQLRIRGEGGSKFADVYYAAPTGKKLRSMVEVQKYLAEHPEYVEQGVTTSQFSFQIPRPLQENYVRKKPPRLSNSLEGGLPRPVEPEEVKPLSWVAPTYDDTEIPVQNGDQDYPHPSFESFSPPPQEASPPEKKKASRPRIYIKNRSSSNNSAVISPVNEDL